MPQTHLVKEDNTLLSTVQRMNAKYVNVALKFATTNNISTNVLKGS